MKATKHTLLFFSEYVQDHWQEDQLFAHQFLNGVNPTLIQRCSRLPANLPVTSSMVFPTGEATLEDELEVIIDQCHTWCHQFELCADSLVLSPSQKGNIFLCDYKCLDGVEVNTINGKQQYLSVPLVLLHQTSDNKLMPIAIQVWSKRRDFTHHTVGKFTACCSSSSRLDCGLGLQGKAIYMCVSVCIYIYIYPVCSLENRN